jgi:hypothetical protein
VLCFHESEILSDYAARGAGRVAACAPRVPGQAATLTDY